MERIQNFVGTIGSYMAMTTLIALVTNLIIRKMLASIELYTLSTAIELIDCLIVTLAIILVTVPEGFPLSVIVNLAYSVNRMRKENNLVRKLEAVETMGGVNEICTHKTGTLTENRLTIVQFYCEGDKHETIDKVSEKTRELILSGCTLNNYSHIIVNEKTLEERRVGNQTECSMLDFVNKSFKRLNIHKTYENVRNDYKILKTIPFNSDTKTMSVVVELEYEKKVRVFTKGASESIIGDCITMIDKQGQIVDLDISKREKVKDQILKQMT